MAAFDLSPLQKFYGGFDLTEPQGNNAFSFGPRRNQRIRVAPLREGALEDLAVGDAIAFSEIEDGEEKNRRGLQSFLYLGQRGKDIFIFDNHNHAFFFWMAGIKYGRFPRGLPLLHVDQHSDMREPDVYPDWPAEPSLSLRKAFEYTNFVLNVGNFIQPALRLGVFSEAIIVDGGSTLSSDYSEPYVLDIDLDIFAPEMNYIDDDWKVERIRSYIRRADFITMATSPFFIDQERAIHFVRRLFSK